MTLEAREQEKQLLFDGAREVKRSLLNEFTQVSGTEYWEILCKGIYLNTVEAH